MLFRIGEELLARGEVPLAPRRDHLDVGLQRVVAELEADLVVALAGRAVRHGVGACLARDFNLTFGDQRPGNRRTEKVLAFVDGVGAKHREHEVADEFFAQIIDVDLRNARRLRLGPRGLELLALADVGGESHDFAAVRVLQPFQDDGSVEATGVGKNDFHLSRSWRLSS